MNKDNLFPIDPEKVRKISENDILNIYFLNVDIFLIIHYPIMNFLIWIDNISVEGTVSQNFDIGPGSFFNKKLNKYS